MDPLKTVVLCQAHIHRFGKLRTTSIAAARTFEVSPLTVVKVLTKNGSYKRRGL